MLYLNRELESIIWESINNHIFEIPIDIFFG